MALGKNSLFLNTSVVELLPVFFLLSAFVDQSFLQALESTQQQAILKYVVTASKPSNLASVLIGAVLTLRLGRPVRCWEGHLTKAVDLEGTRCESDFRVCVLLRTHQQKGRKGLVCLCLTKRLWMLLPNSLTPEMLSRHGAWGPSLPFTL